ncbi:glycosyl hydrolase [Bacillus sp. SA1-12]|uniref:glycosyl hydrolase n=1 Tax=Bacillus sp. SA1-12 TaxID=1455638 RepID=UPI0006984DA0|nr:glycosyl hydrolase [Bacillus sp. SA1-12]
METMYLLKPLRKNMFILSIMIAFIVSVLPITGMPVKAAEEIKLEAEDASLMGVTVENSEQGYSGSGYVASFSNASDAVIFTVEVPDKALYSLTVGYGSIYGSGKVANIVINGNNQGTFTMGNGFGEVSGGKILLNAGKNTIQITPNWTWFAIDYIKLKPVLEPVKHEVEKTLINLNASKETRALFSYLVDQFGEKILSGQQDYPSTRPGDLNYIYQTTGKYPAILGLDFIDNSPSREERGASADETPVAIDWWKKGGIVTFTWHWNAPKDLIDEPGNEWWSGFYTRATTFDVEYALNNPDSEDYQLLLRDIDVISAELKKLKDAGVPVLWRPLHEAEGGWFWWGAKGPEPAKELWRLMYDRMTNVHGLNNLIWVWNSIDEEWYPGDDFVDIVSFDSYPGAHNYGSMSSQYEALVELSSNKKVVAMAENGPIPDPDLLQLHHVNYSWFNTWNGSVLKEHTSPEHLKKVYNHDYVVTLDELPDLTTYLEKRQFQKISDLLTSYSDTGQLKGPLLAKITNSFKQLEGQFEKGHKKQAVIHLENMQKHVNHESMEEHVSITVKKDLNVNLNELKGIILHP